MMKLGTFINDPVIDFLLSAILMLLIKIGLSENVFPLLSTVYLIAAVVFLIVMFIYVMRERKNIKYKYSSLFSSIGTGLIPIFVLQNLSRITVVGSIIIILLFEIISLCFVIGGFLPIFANNDNE